MGHRIPAVKTGKLFQESANTYTKVKYFTTKFYTV